MNLGTEDKKDDPLILNFSQIFEYTDSFLMGKLLEQPEKVGDDVVRKKFVWEAIDATTKDENDEKQKTFVLSRNVIEIESGEVSPRKIYMLLPDRFSEVPDELKRGFSDDDPKRVLGLVLAKFYEAGQMIEALERVANNEPEIFEKVEFAVKNQDLDDAVKQKFSEMFNANMQRMEQMDSTNGGEI